jgi:hypothetical protein
MKTLTEVGNEFHDLDVDGKNARDVKINNRTFRIFPPSSRHGSWIVAVALGGKSPEPDIFARIQDLLLSKCQYLREDGTPQQLWNGKCIAPDAGLDTDIDTLDQLVDEAFEFSVGPTVRRHVARAAAKAKAEADVLAMNP